MSVRKILTSVFAGLLMAACGAGNDGQQQPDAMEAWLADSASIKVAVMPTIDCLPLYVADELGLFERENVSVSLYPYQAQMDCDTALAGGWVDGMMTDLVRAERLQQEGLPLHYATATNLSWQLLTSRQARIKMLPQLDDKMLAMTRYSGTALLADKLVDSVGLKTERVFRIQVNDVAVRLDMLQTGVMDALLLPEPQATAGRQAEALRLYDSRQSDLWLGVMAFSEKVLADTLRREQMDGLLRAYSAACDTLTAMGLSPFRALIAEKCGVSPAVVDSMEQNLAFPAAHAPRQTDIDRAREWMLRVKN